MSDPDIKEKDARLDVVWRGNDVSLDFHFCRQWDGDSGCYGTNPEHGHTFTDAKKQISDFHRKQAEYWDSVTFEDWLRGDAAP